MHPEEIAVDQPAVIREGWGHCVHYEIVAPCLVPQHVLLDQAVPIAGQAITGARLRKVHMDIPIDQELRYLRILC